MTAPRFRWVLDTATGVECRGWLDEPGFVWLDDPDEPGYVPAGSIGSGKRLTWAD